MTKNNNLPVIDWSYGQELDERNTGLMKELLQMFCDQLPDMQAAITKGFQERNMQLLGETLHKFHGSCAYCGLSRLQAVVSNCSTLIKQQKIPESSVLDEINREIELVKGELKGKGYL